MADDDRAKRLKTSESSEDCSVAIAEVAELRGRQIAELESENEILRLENAQFRGLLAKGDHTATVLPVVRVVTATVDLSCVDTNIVTQISSFLGSSDELFNLALTCKSFGWRQPTSTLNWSLVEEVARQAVRSRATDAEMNSLPQYFGGTTTWLSILHRFEQLLMFDVLLGGYIEHRHGDKTTVCATKEGLFGTAVSSGYVMRSGAHYAEFQIISGRMSFIGIVRPMPRLDAGSYEKGSCYFIGNSVMYSDFLSQRTDDWGDGNVNTCEYSSYDGKMNWTDWDEEDERLANWEGMESCSTGDTIGMLLNLDNGTLSVFKNSRRLGVMKDGLSGPYCWFAAVYENDAVAIQKGSIPGSNEPTPGEDGYSGSPGWKKAR
ncbi:hypothetical protein THAOC_10603 [Thalassiosira oceanica]|uniref:B30.2/SPRY domain-containing protein n=1 Tax=Thalassiosira oceanica TaxID=159749 RepID=K0TCN7_THAOC|nr:hypothetical protein THAOC_10603 [Thalassiosira oceanica]|eukprot:EJK68237.1 hypothetical protein THAOC_10603 [Thalassiosira oceanica]